MDEQKRYAEIGKIKAFDVAEQVIKLNTALYKFFETEGYDILGIGNALNGIETSNWIDGLYEWVCEGRPVESIRLTGFVRGLLKQ
jgi:hypothetical protein